jgi:hypothetical protein
MTQPNLSPRELVAKLEKRIEEHSKEAMRWHKEIVACTDEKCKMENFDAHASLRAMISERLFVIDELKEMLFLARSVVAWQENLYECLKAEGWHMHPDSNSTVIFDMKFDKLKIFSEDNAHVGIRCRRPNQPAMGVDNSLKPHDILSEERKEKK